MTNQLFKNSVLPFVVDAYDQSVYDSKIVFSTQDIGTAKLIFKLRKDGVPLPLSAVDVKLVLLFNNGSKNVRNITFVDKVEGIAEYVLDNNEIKLYGKVQASLNLYYRNGQALSIHEFTFEIQRNLIDQDIAPAAEFYIDDFQTLKAEIERKAVELETDIKKRTDDMQGNIDKITKELQEQLDRMKEKLDDLEALETKQGAQDKVDAALAAAKKYTDTRAETPAGAKDKVAAALEEAKEYVDPHLENKKIHVTESEKSNWNNGQLYRLTPNDGRVARIPNGTDIFKLPTGPYMGAQLLNAPVENDTSFYYVNVLETAYEQNEVVYKCIIATRSFDNITWIGTFHAQGFKGWDRVLSEKDLNSSWNQVTLVAGTTIKQFAGNPLKFSIRQNELLLRGSFEGVSVNDAVIARFTQKPLTKAVFVGATVGSYGSARFTLDTDGSLRFDGMSANDNSFVSRFEINESIPLW
ncbi:BppU family phage baseplate upper protein [Bacillus pumilus]|uniref:BppU family phage baseplate upper protein n=1 Tax=Bacillus pumilus TaxID=1408 RepID=UPI00273EA4DB|nr:BppU family phage baseplate upper protein [Bacillus pumilus]WLP59166.1 BppU family phage baseplate upper protein [Bacillus pumilus]